MADANDPTPKARTKICRFFKSKKGCKFGNECQFLHPEKQSNHSENVPQEAGKMIVEKKQPDDSDAAIKTSTTAKTCRFFKSKRGCKFGKECQFLHTEKPPDKLGSISEEVGKLDGSHNQADEPKVSIKLPATPLASNKTLTEEKRMEAGKDPSDRQGIVCKFFKKKKGCLRGSRCPFAHVISGDGAILKPLAKEVLKKASKCTSSSKKIPNQSKENTKPVANTKQVTKQMESDNLQLKNQSKKPEKEQGGEASGQGIQSPPNTDGTGMGLMDCKLECQRLRSIEIQQLKRRFGGQGDYCEIQENISYKIKFKPTDPDWPFNIEAVYLTVSFPEDYPLHIFDAYLSEEQGIAEDIIKFANKIIQQWTLNQEEISNNQRLLKLYFRPFLRWFDRNLESLFVDGGKEARSKYVSSITSCSIIVPDLATGSRHVNEDVQDNSCESPPSSKQIDVELVERNQNNEPSESCQTFEKENGKSFSNDMKHKSCTFKDTHSDSPQTSTSNTNDRHVSEINNLKQVNDMEGASLTLSKHDSDSEHGVPSEDTAQSNQSEPQCNDSVALSTDRRGTEIQFKGLNLEESVSTLRGSRVVFTLECSRCKQRIDQQLSVSGPVSKQCTRCASVFAVNYRPAIIHQFSSVLGYLDLDGCMPFDVVLTESELMLGCLHCSKETTVKGIQYGANRNWCSHCHTKLGFQIQSTRFQKLQLSEPATASLSKNKDSSTISKPKKQIRSSGIKEGQPLPANGTCKHYKKSFRWLRFPCCGKCYPCDLCHEEQEDHEMKYATRMVCGFCSREQPYSQQPCSGCKSAVTKSRSAHWEGGKGCRDKVTMSRNDEQKHKQSGKTMSRKAQKRSEGKGKGKGSKGK